MKRNIYIFYSSFIYYYVYIYIFLFGRQNIQTINRTKQTNERTEMFTYGVTLVAKRLLDCWC